MQNWYVSHSKEDKTVLHITESKVFPYVVDLTVGWLCEVTKHPLCSPPEWTFHVPLSRNSEVFEGLRIWERSLADILLLPLNWAYNYSKKYEKEVLSVPLTTEQAREVSELFASLDEE